MDGVFGLPLAATIVTAAAAEKYWYCTPNSENEERLWPAPPTFTTVTVINRITPTPITTSKFRNEGV